MTEVSLYEAPHAPDPTGGRLVAWAASLTAAHKIGSALCNTSFVPATFKGKPEEAAAAILFGDEIGLTPTQSLQSVYVISGRPALYARAMVAIVLAAGHEVETVEKSDAKVTVRGRRRGSENWTVESWTTARAQKAGYTSNKKYESDPAAMLYARAASDLCRQIAPDALAGIGYSVEELEIAEPTKVTITRADKPKAKAPEPVEPAFEEPATGGVIGGVVVVEGDPEVVARKVAAALTRREEMRVTEPEIIEAEIVEPTFDDPEPEPLITGPQLTKLNILLTQHGYKERDEKLQRVSEIVGREIGSSKELTKAEASTVIEALS